MKKSKRKVQGVPQSQAAAKRKVQGVPQSQAAALPRHEQRTNKELQQRNNLVKLIRELGI